MKITKETKGIRKEDFRYVYEGDLVSGGNLEIDLDRGLYVTGSIEAKNWIEAGDSIEAGGLIDAGDWITVGGSIDAGGLIKAGDWIEAGGWVKAGGLIDAGSWIEAGDWIEAGVCPWREVTNRDKTVTCGKLLGGKVVGILKEMGLPESEDER